MIANRYDTTIAEAPTDSEPHTSPRPIARPAIINYGGTDPSTTAAAPDGAMSASLPSAVSSLSGDDDTAVAVATVRAAAEALWTCRAPVEARAWLRRLSRALEALVVAESNIAAAAQYDPAEVFLAVQGAVLRLRPLAATDAATAEQAPRLRVDALATVAALCRGGVGPAWRRRRREEEDQQLSSPSEGVASDAPTVRRGSTQWPPPPLSSSPHGAPGPRLKGRLLCGPDPLEGSGFPHIPEVLPAAMVRFAAAMAAQDYGDEAPPPASLLLAQTEVFAALLGRPPENEDEEKVEVNHTFSHPFSPPVTWDVPDVQPQLWQFFAVWLAACRAPGCTWALRRRLLRHLRDLVQCIGWSHARRPSRPDAVDGDLEDAIIGAAPTLLRVAQDAMAVMSGAQGESHNSASLSRPLEDRFEIADSESSISTAVAAGAAAVAVLVQLGARRLLSADAASELAGACRALHTQAIDAMIQMHPTHVSDDQRSCSCGSVNASYCGADTWNEVHHVSTEVENLFYVMATQAPTAATYIDVLMQMVVPCDIVAENGSVTSLQDTWSDHETRICRQAGKAIGVLSSAFWTDTADASCLRIYWLPFLGEVLRILKSYGSCLGLIEDMTIVSELECAAADIFVSLSRAMVHERKADSAIKLSELEWEAIIHNFDDGITVWLSSPDKQRNAIRDAIDLFLMQLCKCLEYCYDFMDIPFIEFSCQKQLYLILLRNIIPLVGTNQAQDIGLVVFKCWLKFGLFPFQVENVCATASEVLNEAFRKCKQGDYIHTPRVRLQALRILTTDDIIANEIGDITQDKVSSLLCLMQHNREQYIHLVGCIIPILREIFDSTKMNNSIESAMGETAASNAKIGIIQCSYHQIAKELASQFEHCSRRTEYDDLACYGIELAGRIFRADSGHRDHRQFCIDFFQAIALNKCSSTSETWVSFRVRLAATLELEKCVSTAFTTLLHAHACVPSLIESLANIFDQYAKECAKECTDPVNGVFHSQLLILTAAALCPLTRLRVALDEHVVFTQDQKRSGNPYDIMCWCYEMTAPIHRFSVIENFGASTFEFTHHGGSCSNQIKTLLSFKRIVESAESFLQRRILQNSDLYHDVLPYSLHSMRIHCLDILRHYFIASAAYRIPKDALRAIVASDVSEMDYGYVEIQAKCLVLTQYAENIFAMEMQHTPNSATLNDEVNHFDLIFDLVLDLFEADLPLKRKIGSHAVCALLSMLSEVKGNNSVTSPRLERIFSSLRNLMLKISDHAPHAIGDYRVAEDAFAVIFDILAINPSFEIPLDIRFFSLRIFFQLAESSLWMSEKFCNILGLHCVAKILDIMDSDELHASKEVLMATESNHICVQAVTGLINGLENQLNSHSTGQYFGSDTDKNITFDALATQEELLKQFVWDYEDPQRRAAWLIGDCCIFTCRVGACTSKYAGYIEMVFRSQIERKIAIFQISHGACVNNEDLDLMLHLDVIDENGNKSDEIAHKGLVATPLSDETARVKARFNAFMAKSENEPTSLRSKNVKDVCARFDNLFPSHIYCEEESNPHEEEKLSMPEVDVFEQWVNRSLPTISVSEHNLICKAITDFLSFSGFSREKEDFPDKSVHDLRYDEKLSRTIGVLDRSPIMNTHKIALLYDRSEEYRASSVDLGDGLLSTKNCSPAFHCLANGLGKLIPTLSLKGFSGGLDTSSQQIDGRFAYFWTNVDETQSIVSGTSIVFHVVSLMPLSLHNNVVHRKRHIGNDFVIICFSDHGGDALAQYVLSGGELIGGAFGLVVIFVTSLRSGMYRVNVRVRNNTPDHNLNQCLSSFVTDFSVPEKTGPAYIRNMAMRADLACRAMTGSPDALPNFVHRKQILSDLTRHLYT